jgi:hypothetical protein
MSKEMREQINKVKNWKQFLNEQSQSEYKIFRDEPLERIKTIPENLNIVEYLKSHFINKNGELYYEDDYGKLRKINFSFEGNDILIYPDGKYKLLPNEIMKPNVMFFDIRYPNEINQMSEYSNPSPVPFGYRQWVSNTDGKRWVDGNDAFIPVKKVG